MFRKPGCLLALAITIAAFIINDFSFINRAMPGPLAIPSGVVVVVGFAFGVFCIWRYKIKKSQAALTGIALLIFALLFTPIIRPEVSSLGLTAISYILLAILLVSLISAFITTLIISFRIRK